MQAAQQVGGPLTAQSSTTILVQAGTSAAGLQAIIDQAPDGATIVLEEGSYRFTQTVEIDRSGISLVGQGEVIITADNCLMGEPALVIGAPLYTERANDPVQVIATAREGDTSLTLATGHGVNVGDVIWVEQPNDAALFAEIGDTKWRGDKPLRTGLVEVTAVNGNEITLDRGLPFDFSAGATTVEVTQMVRDVTVRGITFRGDFGTSNEADFTNTVAGENGGMMLVVNATCGVRLQDVDIVEPGSNGLVMGKSMDAVITDVSVTGAHNKGDGGNGYAFWLRDITDCSFTDLRAMDVRHAVLFASYTSATGNNVHVALTNRDINFHGGLDHDNTVVVDMHTRTVEEQRYMGAVTFVNPGTTYGAPTDPNANRITFGHVVGTVRSDDVTGTDAGAYLSTLAGNDTLKGGAGNDVLDAGTGNDLIHASGGYDVVAGGAGTDTFVFGFEKDRAIVQVAGGKTIAMSTKGSVSMTDVEALRFDEGTMTVSAALTAQLRGLAGYDRTDIALSFVADDLVNAVTMIGQRNIGFVGNALANNVLGNTGDNLMLGEAGNDRLFGSSGHDRLDGGAGDDYLQGGTGRDTLTGGTGNDTLFGRQDADLFIASGGTDVVEDFSIAEGDRLRFGDYSDAALAVALEHAIAGQPLSTDLFTIVEGSWSGRDALWLTSAAGDRFVLLGVAAQDLHSSLVG